MVLEIKKELPLYQKLGVFTEAPSRPKRKPKVINGGASASLSDYTADVEPEDDLNLDDMTLDDAEDGDTDDLTSGSDDEDLETDDPGAPDEPATDTDDLTAGADDDGGDNPDIGEGNTPDEPATDDGGETADEPATDDGNGEGGGEDLTAGSDDGDTTGEGDDGGDTGDTGGDEGSEKKNFKKEDMKKYVLFQNLMNLHTSLENYISKLNTIDANNTILGHAYREIKVGFQDLQSLLYDYMLLKFSADSYTSAFYFYEQVKAAVLILFSLLEEAKEKAKNEEKKNNPRSKT